MSRYFANLFLRVLRLPRCSARPNLSLHRSCLVVLTVVTVSCHPASTSVREANLAGASSLNAQPMVAEAVLANWGAPGRNYGYFLPVTINGRQATLILDTGTSGFRFFLFAEALAKIGIPVPDMEPRRVQDMKIDSLSWGTVTERSITVQVMKGTDLARLASPPRMPPVIGIVGQALLSHYDLLFDGPARRVRLYQYASASPSDGKSQAPVSVSPRYQGERLSPQMNPSDCTPLGTAPGAAHFDQITQHIQVAIGGRPVEAWFDSGFLYPDPDLGRIHVYGRGAELNDATAELLGVNIHTPHVISQGDEGYLVSFPIMIGTRSVPISYGHVSHEYDSRYKDRPFLQIGLLSFRDRLVLISYSTSRFCVSAPLRTG